MIFLISEHLAYSCLVGVLTMVQPIGFSLIFREMFYCLNVHIYVYVVLLFCFLCTCGCCALYFLCFWLVFSSSSNYVCHISSWVCWLSSVFFVCFLGCLGGIWAFPQMHSVRCCSWFVYLFLPGFFTLILSGLLWLDSVLGGWAYPYLFCQVPYVLFLSFPCLPQLRSPLPYFLLFFLFCFFSPLGPFQSSSWIVFMELPCLVCLIRLLINKALLHWLHCYGFSPLLL